MNVEKENSLMYLNDNWNILMQTHPTSTHPPTNTYIPSVNKIIEYFQFKKLQKLSQTYCVILTLVRIEHMVY